MKKISIIVPILNEENVLPRFLEHLEQFQETEIVIVDGGSGDRSEGILRKWSARSGNLERIFLSAQRGRGTQMNAGAMRASGEILLFLHVDTLLPARGIDALKEALSRPGVVGGAFRLRVESPHLFSRLIETTVNLRSRFLGLPYGDQAIFVWKKLFECLEGYADFPLMEDVDFVRRLKKRGKMVLLQDAVITSPRRWLREGYYYTSLRNLILLVLYFLGVSPRKLAPWYRF
ncbi:MAG: TIGR04283 family arsenosugar biosynthesis glycosyltransferase [Candidatus Manganitrophaceae bacterium]